MQRNTPQVEHLHVTFLEQRRQRPLWQVLFVVLPFSRKFLSGSMLLPSSVYSCSGKWSPVSRERSFSHWSNFCRLVTLSPCWSILDCTMSLQRSSINCSRNSRWNFGSSVTLRVLAVNETIYLRNVTCEIISCLLAVYEMLSEHVIMMCLHTESINNDAHAHTYKHAEEEWLERMTSYENPADVGDWPPPWPCGRVVYNKFIST